MSVTDFSQDPSVRNAAFLARRFQAKLNLGLLGLLLIVVLLVVNNLDFDSLEETYALGSASP